MPPLPLLLLLAAAAFTGGGVGAGAALTRSPIRFPGVLPGFSSNFSFSLAPAASLSFTVTTVNTSHPHPLLSIYYSTAGFVQVTFFTNIVVRSFDLNISHDRVEYTSIQYDGGLKRFGVWLNENLTVSYDIDLTGELRKEAMMVAISGDVEVYDWEFAVRRGKEYTMHSEPLDPGSVVVKPHLVKVGRRDRWVGILFAVCLCVSGGLLAVIGIVLSVMSIMGERPQIAPVEFADESMECGEEKVVLVGEKGKDGGADTTK